jgi:ketosteroid isomerase-like protein
LARRDEANARKDVNAVLAPLADNAVSYDFPPPLQYQSKSAQNADALRQWFETWVGPVTVGLVDPTIVVDGDLAIVFLVWVGS